MLAVVAADENLVGDLIKKFGGEKQQSSLNAIIYKCKYKEHDFLLMITGYGKLNIGSSLSYLVQNYPVRVILNMGTAGSLIDSNGIFSVVIPNKVTCYDVDFSFLGYEPTRLPGVKESIFTSNQDLCDCAKRACNVCGTNSSDDIIASGDMFVCNNRLALSIRRECDAGAVDCESGNIGQFAYQNNIPFVCIKIISNFANNNAVGQYRLYNDEASIGIQRIVNKFLKGYYEE